mmetsp:Transcript_5471/g.20470  ORF Transcript_5471/g.20470 Transcript_5471/m.20470 type:complete len:109 (-) Transcript_5471:1074-1400(-)
MFSFQKIILTELKYEISTQNEASQCGKSASNKRSRLDPRGFKLSRDTKTQLSPQACFSISSWFCPLSFNLVPQRMCGVNSQHGTNLHLRRIPVLHKDLFNVLFHCLRR